jgi:hypothetical protein
MSKRLTSSPRAFKESVCPAASESEIDGQVPNLVFVEKLFVVADVLPTDLLGGTSNIRLSKSGAPTLVALSTL